MGSASCLITIAYESGYLKPIHSVVGLISLLGRQCVGLQAMGYGEWMA